MGMLDKAIKQAVKDALRRELDAAMEKLVGAILRELREGMEKIEARLREYQGDVLEHLATVEDMLGEQSVPTVPAPPDPGEQP